MYAAALLWTQITTEITSEKAAEAVGISPAVSHTPVRESTGKFLRQLSKYPCLELQKE